MRGEVREFNQEEKDLIESFTNRFGLDDGLFWDLEDECDRAFWEVVEIAAAQFIAYGRANPLPQPDSKDTREVYQAGFKASFTYEILKKFMQFIGESDHIRCVNDEAIDEFLSQEQK